MALNNIDIDKIQDINLSNSQNRQDFRDYMFVDEVELAQSVLNNNASLKTHYISPASMNKIRSAILLLEGYYYTNVEDFLNNLVNALQENIDDLINRDTYMSTNTYFPGNFVYYNNELYLCIKLVSSIEPTNTEYWVKLGLRGIAGSIGLGVTYIGEWSSAVEYSEKDMVAYNNNIYIAKTSNSGQVPGVSNSYWLLALETSERSIKVSQEEPPLIWTGDYWWEMIEY